jgi:hypothetical protein
MKVLSIAICIFTPHHPPIEHDLTDCVHQLAELGSHCVGLLVARTEPGLVLLRYSAKSDPDLPHVALTEPNVAVNITVKFAVGLPHAFRFDRLRLACLRFKIEMLGFSFIHELDLLIFPMVFPFYMSWTF